MEKAKGTYQSLVDSIFEDVRAVARRLPKVDSNGTIKITIRPCTEEADTFFGGIGRFDQRTRAGFGHCVPMPDDLATYEFLKPLKPVSSEDKVISFSSGVKSTASTAVVTVQKREKVSLETKDGTVHSYKEWARISVSVSGGATRRENAECTHVLGGTVRSFFEEYSKIFGDTNIWNVDEPKIVIKG